MPAALSAALLFALLFAAALSIAYALYGCARRGDGWKEPGMEEKKVTVSGKKISYAERGTGSPVVLVHGNTGSSRWWSRTMDLPGRRAIALDLPNFGRSEALEVADIDAYADSLAGFIGALGLDKPVVVGHSLGGAVVMAMAARNPSLASALVLVDGAAPSGLKTPEEHYPYIELYRTNKAMMRQALGAVTPTMKDDDFLDALTDDAMTMAGHAFAGNARALARFDYSGMAGDFKGPVLVVWGRKDVIITEAMARETAAAYADSRLEILDGVGHSPMVEDPESFKRLLLDFIAGL
ncbi:MAG: alpha/beta fold hydrolase [Spirochaetes bacterium]|nr:alpha/beta fold hydrolase [Spirochaetota bacterium]MBU1081408.1 alpha/beta fold hydrolase [Spirochaetota bacterium]